MSLFFSLKFLQYCFIELCITVSKMHNLKGIDQYFFLYRYKLMWSSSRKRLEHFHDSRKFPYISFWVMLPPSRGNHYIDFHYHRSVLLVIELHINGIIQNALLFLVYFAQHNSFEIPRCFHMLVVYIIE